MESRQTKTASRTNDLGQYSFDDGETELVRKRLDALLAINAETAWRRRNGDQERDEFEAAAMSSPLSNETTFSYFGLFLGIFPPMAMFLRISSDTNVEGWMLGVFVIVNLVAAIVGFFSGKLVGKLMGSLEKSGWPAMILLAPLVGLLWGMITGGAAGVILFGIGAIFGAAVGGAVGLVAVPAFSIFHRLVKKGDSVELKHFLPLAFGVTFVICGLILGL